MFHLHGLHHRQRLACFDRVARLDRERHHLARHGGRQSAAFLRGFARVGQRVEQANAGSALGGEHMAGFTLGMHRTVHARTVELHPQTIALGRELQRTLCAFSHLQQQLRAIGQNRTHGLTVIFQLKAAAGGAVRLPAIAAAERVRALVCGF